MRQNRLGRLGAGALVAIVAIGGATAAGLPRGFEVDRSAELYEQIDPSKPRNVILFIGDGTDDSMITAARNYQLGADGRFALDDLPFTGAMTTHGLKVGAGPDYPIQYVSDSAPTASAWSTGRKTVDGRISQGPSTASAVPGEDYETVLERYADQGKLTGNITTTEITDATPAAAASHINNRDCEGPQNMATCQAARKANGGKGSIAEQLVDNEIDVLMGGGRAVYQQTTDGGGGQTVLDYAQSQRDYTLVESEAAMNGVVSVEGGPVLGLFASGNLTPMYQPLIATPPPGSGSSATRCQAASRGSQPTLSEMTAKAIQLLDNPNGFFLQAESGMVDKQEHAADICGAIGDLVELDAAVEVALDYQAANPDTLIIVTGDHAHSTQIVPSASSGRQTATLRTADGDPMTVAYSTQAAGASHTGTQIRVAASGPQAANVTGTIDQTDLFRTLLGREPSTLPEPPQPTAPKPDVALVTPLKIDKRKLEGRGVLVSVAASAANRILVELFSNGQRMDFVELDGSGGEVRLSLPKDTSPDRAPVRATATGPGGEASEIKIVTVRRYAR